MSDPAISTNQIMIFRSKSQVEPDKTSLREEQKNIFQMKV